MCSRATCIRAAYIHTHTIQKKCVPTFIPWAGTKRKISKVLVAKASLSTAEVAVVVTSSAATSRVQDQDAYGTDVLALRYRPQDEIRESGTTNRAAALHIPQTVLLCTEYETDLIFNLIFSSGALICSTKPTWGELVLNCGKSHRIPVTSGRVILDRFQCRWRKFVSW